MQQSPFRNPQFWIGILVSLACLAAILFFIDPAQVAIALRTAQYGYLVLAALALLVYLWLRALRWRFMLGNAKISTLRVFHLQNIGFMMTQLLPLRIGDPARAVLVGSEDNLTIGQSISTMVVERVLDMLFVVALLPFTLIRVKVLPDWLREGALFSGYLALGVIVVVIVMANFRPKVAHLATTILDHIPFLDTQKTVTQIDNLLAGLVTLTSWRSGAQLVILSILPWLLVVAAYQFAMRAVGLTPTLIGSAFVLCTSALSIAAPSSPGQVGVFHAAATFAVTALGFDQNAAASFALLYHATNFTLVVLVGIVGLSQTQATFGKVLAETRRFLGQRSDN